MTRTILKDIRDALLADAALIAILGGDYIFMSEIMEAAQFPSVTLRLFRGRSKKRVGYNAIKKRDNTDILQCDVWSKKSRLATYNVADRLDELLVPDSISDTRSWIRISGDDMYESDTKIYHIPLRYEFVFTIEDEAYFKLGYDMLGIHALG